MKRICRILFIKIPILFVLASLIVVLLLKWVPVFYTPLMLKRSIEFCGDKDFKTHKHWVKLKQISNNMPMTVMASEDNRFDEHSGFDFEALSKMRTEHEKYGKRIRGCSTISQQTAKNVFTFCSDTYARKVYEAYWTFLIEKIWGKRRIMEVYLNVIEFGKGVYGVGAAADVYYHTKPARLTRPQCALLAAAMPNPLKRNVARPSGYLLRRQQLILSLSYKLARPDWLP